MKVILDTNIWISFVIGKRLAMVSRLFADHNITIYISDEQKREILDVALRPKVRKITPEDTLRQLLRLFDDCCTAINDYPTTTSPVRDPKDLYLLSMADAIPADYIVSGDKDLLILGWHHNCKIMSITDFHLLLSANRD